MPFVASGQIHPNINESLEELDVGDSPIDNSGTVAALLLDVFPNLVKISVLEDKNASVEACKNFLQWQKVIELYMEKSLDRREGHNSKTE
jgi:hypothetical protein